VMRRSFLVFIIALYSIFSAAQPSTKAGEYFLGDSDPGFGNGTAFSVINGAWDEAISEMISSLVITDSSTAQTLINLRFKDHSGNWGPLFRKTIFMETGSAISRSVDLNYAEYFFGVFDPGQGQGTPILAFDGAFDEAIEAVFRSDSSWVSNSGQILFNIRCRDANNNWGPLFRKTIFMETGSAISRSVDLNYAEYFFGVFDPGQGQGTPILAFDGAFDEAVESIFRSNPTWNLTAGPSLFNIRCRDSQNNWGPLFKKVIFPTGANPSIQLIAQRDTLRICPESTATLSYIGPPGYTLLWFNGQSDSVITFYPTISGYYKLTATLGSSIYIDSVFIDFSVLPQPAISHTGSILVCGSSVITLSTQPTPNTVFQWYHNSNIILGATNPNYLPTMLGQYYVIATSTITGCSGRSLTVNFYSTASFTYTPASSNCTDPIHLTAEQGTGNLYQWKLNGVDIVGATSATYVAFLSGLYSVRVTNGACSSLSPQRYISVISAPSVPHISTSGPLTFCTGGSVTLTSSSIWGNEWSTGDTTRSITVSSAGIYYVVVYSGTCFARSEDVVIYVDSIPVTPIISISGNSTFCLGDSITLTSSSPSGNLWSNGALTRSIRVGSSGVYSVAVSNGICSSSFSSIQVTALPPVIVPTISPSGPVYFCAGSSVILSSSSTTGNTWSNGDTTNSIQVSASGSYSVTVSDGICNSISQVVDAVAVPAISLIDSIQGASHPSITHPFTYDVPYDSNVTSYYWAVTGGSLLSGQGSNSITVMWDSTQNCELILTAANLGCTTVVAKSVFPLSSFVMPNITSCINDTALVIISNPTLIGVANATFRVIYDADSLDYIGFTNLNASFVGIVISDSNGIISLNWGASSNQNIPTGEMVALKFLVKGSSNVSWDTTTFRCELTDENSNILPQTFINGSIAHNSIRLNWSRTICSGQTFNLGTQFFTNTGNYEIIISGFHGACDTLINLDLLVLPSEYYLPPVNICSNQSYIFGGLLLDTTGEYRDTLTNVLGCDSVVVLFLLVGQSYTQNQSIVICPGSSYNFGTQTLSSTGDYSYTFTAQGGCDSTVYLALHIADSVHILANSVAHGICPGDSMRLSSMYQFHDSQYQWFLNGTPLSGETNDTLNAYLGGVYQLQVVFSPTCTLLSNEIAIAVLSCNRIRGDLRYDNNVQSPMAGVPVHLKTLVGNILLSDTTDSLGMFELLGFRDGNYFLDASINYAPGGINATDALAVSRHFSSIFSLSPLRTQAGDVNGNGVTNSLDALVISRRVANLISTFPIAPFVNSRPSVAAQGVPTIVNLRVLSTGDVNGSYLLPVSSPTLVLDTVYSNLPNGIVSVRFTNPGSGVFERGTCWALSPNPTISNNKSIAGSGGFGFTHSFGGLGAGTLYFVRAYARNSAGTYYSNELNFTTPSLPSVTTSPITNISSTGATAGGNVTLDGGLAVTSRGVVYGTTPNLTLSNNFTNNGQDTGVFFSVLSGLLQSTTYFVRAYATNSIGTAYGLAVSFATNTSNGFTSCGRVTDIDSNSYQTIQIGTQCWIQSNLRVGKYRNGAGIPTGLTNAQWGSTNWGAYAIYGNSAANDSLFGKLYSWHAVMDQRDLCPTGWHVPSHAEFDTLLIFLGGATMAGGAMKSTGVLPILGGWNSPNAGASNSSGFTGLPGGYRDSGGGFNDLGGYGYWWSSSDAGSGNASARYLFYGQIGISLVNSDKRNGLSVRCVRD
jgi:uncharacterized protein (TIGR02145 family)